MDENHETPRDVEVSAAPHVVDLTAAPAPNADPSPVTLDPNFSREDLQRMADELSMGDVWRSQREVADTITDDRRRRSEVGMRSFWHAAMRLAIVPVGYPFDAFIDRVRSDDFRLANEAKTRDPNAAAG